MLQVDLINALSVFTFRLVPVFRLPISSDLTLSKN